MAQNLIDLAAGLSIDDVDTFIVDVGRAIFMIERLEDAAKQAQDTLAEISITDYVSKLEDSIRRMLEKATGVEIPLPSREPTEAKIPEIIPQIPTPTPLPTPEVKEPERPREPLSQISISEQLANLEEMMQRILIRDLGASGPLPLRENIKEFIESIQKHAVYTDEERRKLIIDAIKPYLDRYEDLTTKELTKVRDFMREITNIVATSLTKGAGGRTYEMIQVLATKLEGNENLLRKAIIAFYGGQAAGVGVMEKGAPGVPYRSDIIELLDIANKIQKFSMMQTSMEPGAAKAGVDIFKMVRQIQGILETIEKEEPLAKVSPSEVPKPIYRRFLGLQRKYKGRGKELSGILKGLLIKRPPKYLMPPTSRPTTIEKAEKLSEKTEKETGIPTDVVIFSKNEWNIIREILREIRDGQREKGKDDVGAEE